MVAFGFGPSAVHTSDSSARSSCSGRIGLAQLLCHNFVSMASIMLLDKLSGIFVSKEYFLKIGPL